MTYHFVNLVSWRYFSKDLENSIIFLDSLSIRCLAYLLGFKNYRSRSGMAFYAEQNHNFKNALYLTGHYLEGPENQVVLPFWSDLTSIEISSDLRRELSETNSVVIGVSSPKQDRLAQLIDREFSIETIYCLGAAIYPNSKFYKFDRYGLNWLILLLTQPKRTILKVRITIKEFVFILLRRKDRLDFVGFLNRICD